MKKVILTVLIVLASGKMLLKDIPNPKYQQDKVEYDPTKIGNEKLLTIQFPDLNYEISGELYTTVNFNSTDDQTVKFDKLAYDNIGRDSCMFYSSYINADNYDSINITDGVLYHYFHDNTAYIFDKKSRLSVIQLNEGGFELQDTYGMEEMVEMNNGVIDGWINMLHIDGELLIFTTKGTWRLTFDDKDAPFKQVKGAEFNMLNGVGSYGTGAMWVSQSDSIRIYSVVRTGEQLKISLTKQILKLDDKIITQVDYDQKQQKFYVLSLNQIIIANTNDQPNQLYELEGQQCSSISKIKNTLYIACEDERINYIAELHIDKTQGQIQINRYYTDKTVEGIRMVKQLSYDKIALIGDQEVKIIGQSVNRNTLLQLLQNRNKEQTNQLFYSLGLIDVYPLLENSTNNNQMLLAVSDYEMNIISAVRDPPSLECMFDKEELGDQVHLLVVLNTTRCVKDQGDQSIIGGSESLCETFHYIQVLVGVRQYQRKISRLIMITATLIIAGTSLICLGCGVKIRAKLNTKINAIRQKIRKEREKKNEMKEI